MFLSTIAVQRPISTVMFFAAVVLLGIVSVVRLPMQILPDVSPPRGGAYVRLSQDMSPEEFERDIIEPLEGMIAQLPNIKNVQVRSRGGSGAFFMIEFEFGVNVKYRIIELQDQLDVFRRSFPRNMVRVNAFPFDTGWINTELMDLELIGPRSDPYLEGIDTEKLRQQLQNIDGVAEADMWGGRERTVDVQIKQDRLREFGVGMFNVRNTVETFASEPVFLGNIEEGKQRYFVRLDGQFKDTSEVEDVIVKSDGNIAIRHIGEVNDYYRSRRQLRRHDGQPSVGMGLEKEAEVNILELSNRAREVIGHINESVLPPGYKIMVEWDQADEIRDMLWTLTKLACMGVILSMMILYAFIRNIKMTLIICIVIPICVIATFNFMYFSGMSINMLTLMGLAVGVGILIDSSIVVLENVFRHHEQGKDAVKASIVGSHEVGVAVFALTLTNVIAFLPIIFIEGEIRLMFTEGALAIIYPMLLSMLVALTLVPMATSKILKFSRRKSRLGSSQTRQNANSLAFAAPSGFQLPTWFPTMYRIKKKYGTMLKSCLRHRVRLFLAIVMVCMYTYFYNMSQVNQDVLEAPEDWNWFQVYVFLPEGTKQDHTVEVTNSVEDIIIREVPERHHISSRIEEDNAEIWVRLKDPDERERESPEIKESLRPFFEAFGGAEVSFERIRNRGEDLQPNVDTGRSGVIEIRGPEYSQIETISQVFIEQAVNVPGVRDVQSETEAGPLEVHFIIDRDTAAHLQVTPQTIAQAIQSAQRRGETSAIEMQKGDRDIMIVFSQVEEFMDVTQQENDDEGLKFEELLEVPVFSATVGSTVSLSELGRFELRRGMGQVQRENQERIGRILFETAPDANYSEVEQAMETLIENYPIKAGYRMTMGGRSRVIDENTQAFIYMVYLALLLVYMCMAALFESFTKPLVVIFSVPLAIVGIVWMFILTNTPFTETAALGGIFLVGILPNSAILLVHYSSYLIRYYGYTREHAIMRAGYNRLRPILMTVMTTNLGLLPLAIEFRGSEEWTPFARCVIGGLTSSTILTLIIVPGFYFIIEDVIKFFKSIMRYITSWRWVLVFWNKESRSAYREKLTAYRQKPQIEELLEVEVEYLVRIYSQPFTERFISRLMRLFTFNRYSTATGFIPQQIETTAPATQARKKALDGVTFTLEPGIYGLLGPNGAGKTTLLRLLAGIDQPTRGFLSICGHNMKTEAREAQQCIGYLPQEFGVYSHMTAEKYLDYFALLKGIRDRKERKRVVDETLEMVNLTEQRNVPVGQFSGGMKRRIGLAQIFVKPPKVLIVDEPTVGLDPVERVRFRNLLATLSQNRIVILSTHIVDDVAHTCKRLGVMNQGQLLYDGNTSEFIDTVQGKVWEMTVVNRNSAAVESNNYEWREFRKKYQIVGQNHTADGIHLRIVSDTAPAEDAVNAEPTLEDAYIYHTHVKKH